MIIPSYDLGALVDKDGKITPQWSLVFQQLFKELQLHVGKEGFDIPNLSATDIAKLGNSPEGRLIYDSTNKQLLVKKNGSYKIVQTS